MQAQCNGICIYAYDIGIDVPGVAYPHPECELHGNPEPEYISPEEEEEFPPDEASMA